MPLDPSIATKTWKVIHIPPVEPELRRALMALDKGNREMIQNVNTDIQTINTTITNIVNGAEPLPFTWQQYSGA